MARGVQQARCAIARRSAGRAPPARAVASAGGRSGKPERPSARERQAKTKRAKAAPAPVEAEVEAPEAGTEEPPADDAEEAREQLETQAKGAAKLRRSRKTDQRELAALRRALVAAEASSGQWKNRALEASDVLGTLELAGDVDDNPLRAGRLRRTLFGKELRHFLANGPRVEDNGNEARRKQTLNDDRTDEYHGGHTEYGVMNGWGRPDENIRERMW